MVLIWYPDLRVFPANLEGCSERRINIHKWMNDDDGIGKRWKYHGMGWMAEHTWRNGWEKCCIYIVERVYRACNGVIYLWHKDATGKYILLKRMKLIWRDVGQKKEAARLNENAFLHVMSSSQNSPTLLFTCSPLKGTTYNNNKLTILWRDQSTMLPYRLIQHLSYWMVAQRGTSRCRNIKRKENKLLCMASNKTEWARVTHYSYLQ